MCRSIERLIIQELADYKRGYLYIICEDYSLEVALQSQEIDSQKFVVVYSFSESQKRTIVTNRAALLRSKVSEAEVEKLKRNLILIEQNKEQEETVFNSVLEVANQYGVVIASNTWHNKRDIILSLSLPTS